MALPDVYSKAEEAMLADFNRKADSMVGWVKPVPRGLATEESIKVMGLAYDPWNPIWHDEKYAAGTRWGGLIAVPMYLERCRPVFPHMMEIPRGMGYIWFWYVGEDWEFDKPVRPSDSFRVWYRRPELEDITDPDGKGPRRFKSLQHDVDFINQRDEHVSRFKFFSSFAIMLEPIKKGKTKPDYKYTKEELQFLKQLESSERIRGASVLYWEDVKIGEVLTPVVHGPTTMWDQVSFAGGRQEIPFVPMREIIKEGDVILNPETGVYHMNMEWHFSDSYAQFMGNPRAFHFGAFARSLMARCITNWMGDDAFMTRYAWRHVMRTAVGDSVIGRAKVINKRIEKGNYLVDLSAWLENLRGNITEAATATVSLCSRQAPF